jgi:hypothetical protein
MPGVVVMLVLLRSFFYTTSAYNRESLSAHLRGRGY